MAKVRPAHLGACDEQETSRYENALHGGLCIAELDAINI